MTAGFARSYRRETCRLCGSRHLETYLDLGEQPPSNGFLAPQGLSGEKSFPLQVARCAACGFSQLSQVVAAEEMFSAYSYLSSTSVPLKKHYGELARRLAERFSLAASDLLVDVGANDGVMLGAFAATGMRSIGIEPSDAAQVAQAAGHEVVRRFLDATAVEEVLARRGAARVVTATNVFAHIDDLHAATACLRDLLDREGVLVIEAPYVWNMLEELYFDTVYHEHLSYVSVTPLAPFLEACGLRLFDVERVDFGASGPALRLYACRRGASHAVSPNVREVLDFEHRAGLDTAKPYLAFASRVAAWRGRMLRAIDGLKRESGPLGGFTAPAKGNTLLNYLRLTTGEIAAVAETNPRKIGRLTPGTHLPIVGEEEFLARAFRYALLLSWNYAEYFTAHSEFTRRGGRFLVPLPEIRVT